MVSSIHLLPLLLLLSPAYCSTACTLKDSGAVTATRDGEVFQYLHIKANGPAITVNGFKNVKILDCLVEHGTGGPGIQFNNAAGLEIANTSVVLVGVSKGPLPKWQLENIQGSNSPNVRISQVHVEGGSSGIELGVCHGAVITELQAKNARGPFPRGQCVQFAQSNNCVLDTFSCINDETSWTEDSISSWRSSNTTVKNGLVDYNNSPTGVGVMFEGDAAGITGGLCEDVDVIHNGDGAVSAYPAQNAIFRRIRVRDNHCVGLDGRGKPASGGLVFAAADETNIVSHNIQVLQSIYFNLCAPNNVFWEQTKGAFTAKDAKLQDFTPRNPLPPLHFCWQ
jgi:hypothetical protein